MSKNPFDYLNAINLTKKDIIKDSDFPQDEERSYQPFLVNRGLSYFPDAILYASEMNLNHGLDKYLQFKYLLNSCRKAKRFSKWAKASKEDDLIMISEFFNCSMDKSKEIINVLTLDQLNQLKQEINNKGGAVK